MKAEASIREGNAAEVPAPATAPLPSSDELVAFARAMRFAFAEALIARRMARAKAA